MAELIDQLAAVPLFKDLNKKGLERLARVVRTRSFAAGEDIVKQGEEGVGFFLITKGRVAVITGDITINEIGAGDSFGEQALLDNYRRSATCRTTEPTECLALSRWDFNAEVRANPDIAIELLTLMSRRLREVEAKLQEVTKLVGSGT
jgi:CRP-like cAMP-binding protein